MKKQYLIGGCVLAFLLVLVSLIVFLSRKQELFRLDFVNENSSTMELTLKDYRRMTRQKASFALFIYQPMCTISEEFEKVIQEFQIKYDVPIYKMSFSDSRETDMKDYLKYYPSFILFRNGKVVDYLEANKDEDKNAYESVGNFYKWISSFVTFDERKEEPFDSEKPDNPSDRLDIDLSYIKREKGKVNIYLFYGSTCPHCHAELDFFEKKLKDYKDDYQLYKFEVFENAENRKLLQEFSSLMKEEVQAVPYTIIGSKAFKGFSEAFEDAFKKTIKEEKNKSFDVYFDHFK